jgi:hypothetical protein
VSTWPTSSCRPFGLARLDRAAPAVTPLLLQPVEHLVEGAHDRGDLVLPVLRQPLSGAKQVDCPHALDEPVDGSEGGAQQEEVGRQHRAQHDDDVERLENRDRRTDVARDEHEHERAGEQQDRVDREDSPEKRKPREAH